MDIVLKQNGMEVNLLSELNRIKLANIEKVLSDMFENMPDNKNINYIGELNKTDALY